MLDREITIFDVEKMDLLENGIGIKAWPPYVDKLSRSAAGKRRSRLKGAFCRVVACGDKKLLDAFCVGAEEFGQHLAIGRNPRAGDVDKRPVLVEQYSPDRHATIRPSG